MTDLAADLDRIAQHIPCLERAAADESAPAEVRARVAVMARLARSAVNTAGQHRTLTPTLRTETTHGEA